MNYAPRIVGLYMKSRVLYLYDKVKLQAEVTPYQSRRPIDKGIGYISRHSSVIDATPYLFLSASYHFPTRSVIHVLELHFFADPEAAWLNIFRFYTKCFLP